MKRTTHPTITTYGHCRDGLSKIAFDLYAVTEDKHTDPEQSISITIKADPSSVLDDEKFSLMISRISGDLADFRSELIFTETIDYSIDPEAMKAHDSFNKILGGIKTGDSCKLEKETSEALKTEFRKIINFIYTKCYAGKVSEDDLFVTDSAASAAGDDSDDDVFASVFAGDFYVSDDDIDENMKLVARTLYHYKDETGPLPVDYGRPTPTEAARDSGPSCALI